MEDNLEKLKQKLADELLKANSDSSVLINLTSEIAKLDKD
jgi:hypothetical protein